jgi:cell division septal protein FtsQ
MKAQRSAKNRRLSKPRQRKQQHLLEVTVRRDVARAQRARRVFGFVCKGILLIAVVAGAWLGGKEGLRRFLWENPDYYLTEVRVPTDGALTREQILTTSGIVIGRNIFAIDLARAREALDKLPQVERVEVRRKLPNRIDIAITERQPIAWITDRPGEDPTTSERAFLVDARGVVMRSKRLLPEYLHLPVISGVVLENLAPGQRIRSFEMQAALDLVRLTTDNTRFQPRILDIEKRYCVVVTDQNRRKVTFGLKGIDGQVAKLMRCLDLIEPTGREIQKVNLLVDRNTPVVFAEPPSVETEPDVAPTTPSPKAGASKEKEKPGTTVRKAEPAATPPRAKESTPSGRKREPTESVKKPFRLHG